MPCAQFLFSKARQKSRMLLLFLAHYLHIILVAWSLLWRSLQANLITSPATQISFLKINILLLIQETPGETFNQCFILLDPMISISFPIQLQHLHPLSGYLQCNWCPFNLLQVQWSLQCETHAFKDHLPVLFTSFKRPPPLFFNHCGLTSQKPMQKDRQITLLKWWKLSFPQ